MLARPHMADVQSVNPVVGETNDGYLNDIRARPIRPEHVAAALERAAGGPVEEGSVGAGTGTVAFGWKGGIGTSSRRLPASLGGYTVGVLVQSNFGGVLTINGAPVGRELGRYAFQEQLEGDAVPGDGAGASGRGGGDSGRAERAFRRDRASPGGAGDSGRGSIVIVAATDAPLEARNLDRLAARALIGLGRTGAVLANGSGDYVIAFSTVTAAAPFDNDDMSPLFQAVAEATEEAIYNSLFRATSVTGYHGTVEALPLDRTLEILRAHDALDWGTRLRPASPPGSPR
jgi:D-aminopeptidase